MKPLTRVQRVLAMREASAIERAHTIRHHGSYTDGQHSFDMLTLTLELREETSAALMRAIIYHDLPERWIGDMPHPAKYELPGMVEHIHQLEDKINRCMDWGELLTDEETTWLHTIDRLEFLLWADDQVQMGNRHLEDVLERCWNWFEGYKTASDPIAVFLQEYKWQRTPDSFPF